MFTTHTLTDAHPIDQHGKVTRELTMEAPLSLPLPPSPSLSLSACANT